MTIRSNKYRLRGSKKSVDYLANPNAYNIVSQFWRIEDIEPRKINIKNIENIIQSNIYHDKCIQQNILSAFGKGYTDDTDELVIDRFPLDELLKCATDYEYYGECWIEHTILNGEIMYSQSIPTSTIHLGKKKYAGKAVQNYGTKEQIEYDLFDIDDWKAGRLRSGVYAQQIKWGRKKYGVPVWIAALETLKIMKYSEVDLSAFYENRCIPYYMLFTKGVPATAEGGEDMVDFFERQFQAVGDKHKVAIIQSPLPPDQADMELKELSRRVVDADYLKLRESLKFDICAANGVPYWRVGLSKTTGLGCGSSQEREMEWFIYKSDKIEPERKVFIDQIQLWHPNTQVDFVDNELPVSEITEQLVMEQKARASEQYYNMIDNINELNESRPNK